MFSIFCQFPPSVPHKLEMGVSIDYQAGRFFSTINVVWAYISVYVVLTLQ